MQGSCFNVDDLTIVPRSVGVRGSVDSPLLVPRYLHFVGSGSTEKDSNGVPLVIYHGSYLGPGS